MISPVRVSWESVSVERAIPKSVTLACPLARQQYVARLNVAVDDSLGVSVFEGFGDLAGDAKDVARRHAALLLHDLAQTPSFDVLHDEVVLISLLHGVVDADDRRMVEARGELSLSHEASERVGLREVARVQHLESHRAVEERQVRAVDESHPAFGDEGFEGALADNLTWLEASLHARFYRLD